jgi:hypothetical protein
MPKKQVIAIVDDDELAREGTIDLSLTEIVEIFPISNFWPELNGCWPEGSCLKPDGSAILLSTVGSMRSRPFN